MNYKDNLLDYIIDDIKDHQKNEKILKWIYIGLNILSLILSTIVSLMLGSQSISNIHNTISLVSFIFNVISTISISIVNTLKLETKIEKHCTTFKKMEELKIEMESCDLNDLDLLKEKYKMIKSDSPDLCF